ncbi:hypothetical protein [Cellulomonas sp. HZM]|uniref:hypothetical protein n=1 Tax=Cellulomonas sp. HZM TaxID=1454010 RepID=UPI0004930CB6|nr:hypothetical protein [Cellulomonas sp. HZM]
MSVTLCCLLWAREGLADDLSRYEDGVLALLAEHGAGVTSRVRALGRDATTPTEVQVIEFADRAGLDAYLGDPRRTARADERDRVVARTELFEVEPRPLR